jgi:glutamine synthetase
MKKKAPVKAALDVVCRSLKETRAIRFSGDNYSAEWRKEAKRRHLPMIDKSIYAFDAFMTPSALKAFESVLSKEELHARVEIMKERYCKMLSIEARLLLDTAQTQILPAAMACQKNCAEGIKGITPATQQKAHLKKITHHIERMMSKREELEKCRTKALSLSLDAQMLLLGERGAELCRLLREEIDTLEKLIDDALWPSPKYREMLYIL